MKFFAVPFEVTDNEIIVPKLLSMEALENV